MTNMHTSAKELVIKAAEQSGLLQEIAEFLWFASRPELHGRCSTSGMVPALVAMLAEAFDEHVYLPHGCAEGFFGEGLGIFPGPDEAHEVAAFIG